MRCLFSAESVDTFRRRGSKDHPCSQLPPVCPDRAHGMGSIRTHGPWPVPPGRATGFARERPGCPPRRPLHKVLRSVVHHLHRHQGNSRRAGLYNAMGLYTAQPSSSRISFATLTKRYAGGAPGRKERLKEFRDSVLPGPSRV